MTRLKCLLLASSLLASVSAAQADMKINARAGKWWLLAGTTTDLGTPMCQMSTTSDMRAFQIKTSPGFKPAVHIGKNNWNIPAGSEMAVVIRFDKDEPLRFTAKRLIQNNRFIEIKLEDNAPRFMEFVKDADSVSISFPGGSEKEWVLSLDGSDTIAQKYEECVVALKKKYSGDNATQPHGSKPSEGPDFFDKGEGPFPKKKDRIEQGI